MADSTTLQEGKDALRQALKNHVSSFSIDYIEDIVKILLFATEYTRPQRTNTNWRRMETILAETIAKIKKIKEI